MKHGSCRVRFYTPFPNRSVILLQAIVEAPASYAPVLRASVLEALDLADQVFT